MKSRVIRFGVAFVLAVTVASVSLVASGGAPNGQPGPAADKVPETVCDLVAEFPGTIPPLAEFFLGVFFGCVSTGP